ncbi:MAG TPA: substrate-binding domain-containing protein [Thermodesulfobacteriota bacterium]|nr:substrate-binding domain-containing protein [Thermodesulfobacteriota bacterium]
MKKSISAGLFCLLLLFPSLGLAQSSKFILMASTIGPIDSGIIDLLENQFEKETGIRVRHVGAGTGAALDIAKQGNVDLVLVHAKSLEEKFVAEGFGTERIALMYNDFVIVGPQSDPAGINGMKSALEALKRISQKEVVFVTRGDRSGTHVAEMELWQRAGIKPQGSWYYTCPRGAEGNMPTLRHTDKMEAYTLIDRATVLAMQKEIKLVVLVEKDEVLLNFISLIPVNPQKFPKVNYADTMKFVKWLTSPEKGQQTIADFGKDKYGAPLFFANSKEWREKQGLKN